MTARVLAPTWLPTSATIGQRPVGPPTRTPTLVPIERSSGREWWSGFPSTFPPPDSRLRGTRNNSRVRRGRIEAARRPFAHVTANDRDQAGTEGNRGGPPLRPVKSPASAYPGSNPGPATSATTSADMVTIRARPRNPPGRLSLILPSRGRPADARRSTGGSPSASTSARNRPHNRLVVGQRDPDPAHRDRHHASWSPQPRLGVGEPRHPGTRPPPRRRRSQRLAPSPLSVERGSS
jgi:hypothetical protein